MPKEGRLVFRCGVRLPLLGVLTTDRIAIRRYQPDRTSSLPKYRDAEVQRGALLRAAMTFRAGCRKPAMGQAGILEGSKISAAARAASGHPIHDRDSDLWGAEQGAAL